MEMNKIQKKVAAKVQEYGAANGIDIDVPFLVMKLYEEVGELTNALLIHEGKARKRKLVSKEESTKMLRGEIADVVGSAIAVADALGIDSEKVLQERWFLNERRGNKT